MRLATTLNCKSQVPNLFQSDKQMSKIQGRDKMCDLSHYKQLMKNKKRRTAGTQHNLKYNMPKKRTKAQYNVKSTHKRPTNLQHPLHMTTEN